MRLHNLSEKGMETKDGHSCALKRDKPECGRVRKPSEMYVRISLKVGWKDVSRLTVFFPRYCRRFSEDTCSKANLRLRLGHIEARLPVVQADGLGVYRSNMKPK